MRLIPFNDAPYHGTPRSRPFFEGWYLKQACGAGAFAAISGVYRGMDAGADHAFIQVIFSPPPESYFIRYPVGAFDCARRVFDVRIGQSAFSMDGALLHIPDIGLEAELKYTDHIPLKSGLYAPTIMGPFAYLPGMQCRHGVLSLWHGVRGEVCCKSRHMRFDGADGYIEKDWGRAFPDRWVWMQCGDRMATLMAAVASIPVGRVRFNGLIGVLRVGEKQYRFATYNGAHIKRFEWRDRGVEMKIERGDRSLHVKARDTAFGHLMAPTRTGMDRRISESIGAQFDVALEAHGETIFKGSYTGGLEMLDPEGLTRRNASCRERS